LKYVLDSNIAIAAMNGVAPVIGCPAEIDVSDIGIPLVAIGELVYGAYRSKHRDENVSRIAGLRRSIATLPLTDDIADRYGATRADLHARGIAARETEIERRLDAFEASKATSVAWPTLKRSIVKDQRARARRKAHR
jgi:tRNA(fMet)-specific endonuclease VapC